MTNEEILTKAIKKASKNGYNYEFYNLVGYKLFLAPNGEDDNTEFLEKGINDIIFSHDFAKAFWGEAVEGYTTKQDTTGAYVANEPIPAWKYRLQQMVLEEEPLKYLDKFL